ncbi:hypothetical protein MP638_002375 [Amoeboaphelidium occidentale]|nr:hypothetical protein MP638_002375 [Amoeboaphelidium occidentale]
MPAKYIINYSRYKAQRVHNIIKDQINGALVRPPVWLPVVSALPPLSRPVSIPTQDPTMHKTAPTYELAEEYCSKLQSSKWIKLNKKRNARWRQAVKEAMRIMPIPTDIVFPEDKLRERFRKEYPLEKLRPIVMKDDFAQKEAAQGISAKNPSIQNEEQFVELQQRLINEGVSMEESFEKAKTLFEDTLKKEAAAKLIAERAASYGATKMVLFEEEIKDSGNLVPKEVVKDASVSAANSWLDAEQKAAEIAYEKLRQIALLRREKQIASQSTE